MSRLVLREINIYYISKALKHNIQSQADHIFDFIIEFNVSEETDSPAHGNPIVSRSVWSVFMAKCFKSDDSLTSLYHRTLLVTGGVVRKKKSSPLNSKIDERARARSHPKAKSAL